MQSCQSARVTSFSPLQYRSNPVLYGIGFPWTRVRLGTSKHRHQNWARPRGWLVVVTLSTLDCLGHHGLTYHPHTIVTLDFREKCDALSSLSAAYVRRRRAPPKDLPFSSFALFVIGGYEHFVVRFMSHQTRLSFSTPSAIAVGPQDWVSRKSA
jgi:hypothetical protein